MAAINRIFCKKIKLRRIKMKLHKRDHTHVQWNQHRTTESSSKRQCCHTTSEREFPAATCP